MTVMLLIDVSGSNDFGSQTKSKRDLTAELAPFRKKVRTWDISDFFAEEYFDTKKVIYLPMR